MILWFALITATIKCAAGQSACTSVGYNCVRLSECRVRNLDMNFIYPCNTDNRNGFVCCPSGTAQTEIETRKTSLFPKNCGVSSSSDRIITGRMAEIGQFPWMVLLGYRQRNVEFTQFLCGGTLINQRYVLTAAHCVSINPRLELTIARLGELDILTDIDCGAGQLANVCADPHIDVLIEDVIKHDKFNGTTFKNDIALIRLRRPVNFTEFIQPICLPFDEGFMNLTHEKLTVSGWGKTQASNAVGSTTLQFTTIKVWNQTECNKYAPPTVKPILKTQICANGETTEDACAGDSGGPLANLTLKNRELRYIQLGIVSFASTTTCGNAKLPTVYTRVDQYLKWILDNVY